MKRVKVFLSFMLLMCVFALPLDVSANEIKESEENIIINAIDLEITTEYSKNDFNLVLSESDTDITATIKNKNNEEVERFVFEKVPAKARLISQKRFHNYKTFGSITLDCDVNVNLYTSGSFRQINSIASSTLRISTTASTAFLEGPQVDCYSKSGSYPTMSVGVNYATTIAANKQSAVNAGVSGVLINAGYTTTDNIYYRKYATGGYTISL